MAFEETRLHNLVSLIIFGFVLSNLRFIFANLVFLLPFNFYKSGISSSLQFLQLDISSSLQFLELGICILFLHFFVLE